MCEHLYKLSKEYLNVLTCKFNTFSGQNLEIFWHIKCLSTIKGRKVINSEKQSVFLAHPVYYADANFLMVNVYPPYLWIYWTSLHQIFRLSKCLITCISFNNISRDVAMVTNFRGEIGDIPLFVVLAFWNEWQYCNSNFKRLTGLNFSALCKTFVRFGPVTPDFRLLEVITFAKIRQKSA